MDDYDKLTPEEREKKDREDRERERQEQASRYYLTPQINVAQLAPCSASLLVDPGAF